MTYHVTDGYINPQPIADISTTQKVPLGKIVRAYDSSYGEGEFIYLQGVANTAVGTWVTYNADDWSTTLLASNAIGPVAIAMAACVASRYGWYQISGKAVGLTSASVADNGNLYCTAASNNGKVDDTDVAGDYIRRAKAASAVTGAGSIDVEISRPEVADGLDN